MARLLLLPLLPLKITADWLMCFNHHKQGMCSLRGVQREWRRFRSGDATPRYFIASNVVCRQFQLPCLMCYPFLLRTSLFTTTSIVSFNHRFYSRNNLPSATWTSRGWSQVSTLPRPRFMPSFLSRTGFSIPTFHEFVLVDFHQCLLTRALALSARRFLRKTKVPTSSNM